MNHEKIFNTVTANGMREMTLERFREAIGMLWTSPCICPPDEKTGETLCCNICGCPTARTSKELPGDEDDFIKYLDKRFSRLRMRNGKVSNDKTKAEFQLLHEITERYKTLASPIINELRGELTSKDARIRELEEWISVEDRLPENFQSVICHTHIGSMVIQSYSLHSEQDDKWFKERFTHWKNLPTPPKN